MTVDRVIEGEAKRARFVRDDGAAAIDMETEWVGRACTARNIPMLSLRAISDTAAAPFPAPPDVLFDLERQQTSATRLARHLFTHPSAVVRLMRFARQIPFARATPGCRTQDAGGKPRLNRSPRSGSSWLDVRQDVGDARIRPPDSASVRLFRFQHGSPLPRASLAAALNLLLRSLDSGGSCSLPS